MISCSSFGPEPIWGPINHGLKEASSPGDKTLQCHGNAYGKAQLEMILPRLQADLWPFTKETIYWGKNDTHKFGELLDTGSKLALISRHVKHHHGPDPVHSEFSGFMDLPSNSFPNHQLYKWNGHTRKLAKSHICSLACEIRAIISWKIKWNAPFSITRQYSKLKKSIVSWGKWQRLGRLLKT